jgi:hypothetical protein
MTETKRSRGRPAKPDKIRVCIKLNKDLYSLFKDECVMNNKIYSEVIEQLVKDYVTRAYRSEK